MSKIGTAHIEIKPVVSDEALSEIEDAIATSVERGVRRGMNAAQSINVNTEGLTADEAVAQANRRWASSRMG